jgi:hypothetical protein
MSTEFCCCLVYLPTAQDVEIPARSVTKRAEKTELLTIRKDGRMRPSGCGSPRTRHLVRPGGQHLYDISIVGAE